MMSGTPAARRGLTQEKIKELQKLKVIFCGTAEFTNLEMADS